MRTAFAAVLLPACVNQPNASLANTSAFYGGVDMESCPSYWISTNNNFVGTAEYENDTTYVKN